MGFLRYFILLSTLPFLLCACSSSESPTPVLASLALSCAVTTPVVGTPVRVAISHQPQGAAIGVLVWNSSDPDTAGVDQTGLVTAKKAGTVTITARATNGVHGGIDLTFVTPPVTALEISDGNRKMFVGDSYQLHVLSAPAYSVLTALQWNSTDSQVVSVGQGGSVTALQLGSAIITVSDGLHSDQVVVTSLPKTTSSLDPLPVKTFPAHAWKIADLLEKNAVAPNGDDPGLRILSERWLELNLTERPFDALTVDDLSRFVITSSDDPAYINPVNPVRIQHRYFPERAPFTPSPAAVAGGQSVSDGQSGYIVVVYRIFLKAPLDCPLKKGCTYTVSANTTTVPGLTALTAKYDGRDSREVIHVNQEAYPSSGPKVASLSAWLGVDGIGNRGWIDFSSQEHPGMDGHFYVVDAASGAIAYTGNIIRTANTDEELYSGSQVWLLDFSGCTASGRFRLAIPGVGESYPFSLGAKAFSPVIYTTIRALTHSRDGNHGLDAAEVTHWNRPAAHLDDAIEESTGQHVDLTGGHMDAGDREKIPVNMAMAVSYLVSASRLFPNQVEALGETLQIPESGNGIPDYLDELFWETDALYKMVANTHQGGAMTAWIKPAWDGFEKGQPPEGATGRIWFDQRYGRLKYATLSVAGALAMASNDPLVRKYDPVRADVYLKAAEAVWSTYAIHEYDNAWWSGDNATNALSLGKHPWSSEVIFAAANLYEATGQATYLQHLQAEWPANPFELVLYGMDAGGLPLQDYLAVALSSQSGMPSALKDQARAWIIQVADFMNTQPHGQPVFGVLFQEAVNSAVGWYFSGLRTGWPNLVAWGVSGDTQYRDHVTDTWNYLLWTNPLSKSHITGLGDPDFRVRWVVNELWDYAWRQQVSGLPGWVEPPPGLVMGDLQNTEYNYWFDSAWNAPRTTRMEPNRAGIPLFYRHVDGWVVYNEASSTTAATMAAIALPFAR